MILIFLSSNINVKYSAYIIKFCFYNRKINFGVYKINISYLDTFKIIIVNYLFKNRL